jgi:peptidoglycan/LPS O-acetylase OafA/YrhL
MQTAARPASPRPAIDVPLDGASTSRATMMPPSSRMRYIPGLDGLRAISVTAVLLYHADLTWMPAGFLGVDVFFVISGYLITSLLLAEFRNRGGIRLGQFYLRRARRLLPALFLVLGCVSLYSVIFLPDEVRALRGDVVGALAYATNWWQIVQEQSYIAAQGRPPLLRHLWSLAVEEQFYLVWPLLLFGMLKLWKGRRTPMLAATLGGIFLSLTAMVWLASSHDYTVVDPSRVYLGSDTRVFTMLVGALLAMVWSPWRLSARISRQARLLLDGVGTGSLVLLIAMFVTAHYQSNFLFRGGFLLVAVLSAITIAVAVHPASRVGTVLLGQQPLRWIGERSYGIYLWHWPVFMVTRPGIDTGITGWPNTVLRIGLTLLIAEGSYRYVEEPIRHGGLGRWFTGVRAATGRERTAMLERVLTTTAVVVIGVVVAGYGLASAQEPRLETGLQFLVQPATTTTTTVAPPVGTPPTEPLPPPQVTAVGDSVMLGAKGALEAKIPGIQVNADVSRQFGHGIDVIRALKETGQLGDVVVVHLGTNGTVTDGHLEALKPLLQDRRKVIFLNVFADRSWTRGDNEVLDRKIPEFGNAVVVNWNGYGSQHPEVFYGDRIHVRPEGQLQYADLVAQQIPS